MSDPKWDLHREFAVIYSIQSYGGVFYKILTLADEGKKLY